MDRFAGTVALITGGTRGIGLAIAQRLVDEGASVVITGRKQESIDSAVALLGAEHVLGVAGRADDSDHRADTLARATARFGRLDHLVNNAGVNPAYGRLLEVDEVAARKILEVNILATLAWTRAAMGAGLGAAGGGAIVNLASIAGVLSSPGIAMYGVSKAAIINLTTQLAWELAPDVRVNAVAPAVIKTDFARALYDGREAEVSAEYPLARLGETADVAGPVAFLLSQDAAWITGQCLLIDGGTSVRAAL